MKLLGYFELLVLVVCAANLAHWGIRRGSVLSWPPAWFGIIMNLLFISGIVLLSLAVFRVVSSDVYSAVNVVWVGTAACYSIWHREDLRRTARVTGVV